MIGEKFVRFADRLNEHLGRAVAWLTAVLVLTVCYDVFSRYLLRQSSVAVQELEWHLFAVIFLLSAAYALKHDRHVRVDVFYVKMSSINQARVNFWGTLLFLLPFCAIVAVASYQFVFNSFRVGEKSPDPGGLPARYLLKAVIPLSFIFLIIQGAALLIRSYHQMRGNPVAGAEEQS